MRSNITEAGAEILRLWQRGQLGQLKPGPSPEEAMERLKKATQDLLDTVETFERLG